MKKTNNTEQQVDICFNLVSCLAIGLAEDAKAPLMSLEDEQNAAAGACPGCLEAVRWHIYLMNALVKGCNAVE